LYGECGARLITYQSCRVCNLMKVVGEVCAVLHTSGPQERHDLMYPGSTSP
jgi:hypothetical protein